MDGKMENQQLARFGRSLAQVLEIKRPLAVIDLETTDSDVRVARIVEIAVLRIAPSGESEFRLRRVDPQAPLAPGAIATHGLTADDLAGMPPFARYAPSVARFLDGCDLAGFGVERFDVPVLTAEFRRVGVPFDLDGRTVIDALRIFHHYQPRDLSAAVRRYAGHEIHDAHSAAGDVLSSLEVLCGQFSRHPELPRDVGELGRVVVSWRREPSWLDDDGRLLWRDGSLCLNFGKHRGRAVADVVTDDPEYLRWLIAEASLSRVVQDALRAASEGSAPQPLAP